ncbi:T9SS outer membrane translocon Sov/SprA [Panacibacter ginsenosidivorans]|uniref:T9SS outer membrane translocon Sov/SprA n=1 Tax=Panacibacter ginsenosidivorans TaxID=1813871 RepID=UPI001CEF92D0|nr:cell surface protein SprA [Panacibacter ginsenosidivorans]
MTRYLQFILITVVAVFYCAFHNGVYAQKTDSLRFPIKDRRGDRFTWRYNNPFDIKDTSIIKQDIEYDPATKQYFIVEKIGNTVYRRSALTFDEFLKLQSQIAEDDYFNERSRTVFDLNRKIQRPKPRVYPQLFDRIFGVGPNGLKVEIKPEGNVDLTAGYQGQNVKNPTLPEAARKNGGFDFNMNANVNIMGNIGDKLKLPISYNTLANFDFENQLKLDYKGKDDEIIKSVEAGNISFQAKGSLMASVQSLFGIKTQLQFGKLFITAALANQRSQRQSLTLQGGGLNQVINKKLDDYDENKHFLMGQYFMKNYDKTMKNLPYVNSQVQILRLEVWVTNRNGATTNTRNIVGLMDLGETEPYNPNIHSLTTNDKPANGANDLYSFLAGSDANRNPALINTILLGKGLTPVNDYEKTFARKLEPTEYYFNPQVGFVSLNQQLQPDEVLAVAYQYTYNGQVYQVGEFSQDVTVDSTQGVQKVLFLKLLKATSQRPTLPLWKLMMKNVYSLDVTGLQSDGFNINVLYQEPSGGLKRYLPETDPDYSGKPLLSILNLDRLNNRNDPLPDGQFDFVDSFTVLSQQGKIIFPVLQPFGDYLDSTALKGQTPVVKAKYLYPQLYDSIKAIAQTYANLDRFYIQGTIKGSSTTDIYLGGFNIPPGSVSVTAGGQILQENVDYIIDYNLGTLKVINQAILNSGVPVNVQYENNASFGIQQRSFLGLRLDYLVNKKLSLGATMQRLTERPFFTKVNYGEDPIQNRMYGVDFNYNSELPGLTRLLNKLPFYDSKAISTINAYGEAAVLQPGHPSQIGKGNEGLIYLDDFEGTTSSIDLRFPFVAWTLASTPQGTSRFPEATLTNNLDYGKNRAKLAWYNIEPTLQDKNSPNNPLRGNLAALSDPRIRAVYTNELFPQRTTNITDVVNGTFDLAYYPTEIGPYNFTDDKADLTADGKLIKPQQRWGGIMRNIDQTDFETSNIEFIEFWTQNPFIKNPNSSGGKLFINLGNISEDVLKDGLRFYENGLNTPTQPAAVDNKSSVWGTVPVNPIQITQAFSNDPADRPYQDVGFDGNDDDSEKIKQAQYLNDLATNFGTGSAVYQNALKDPSHDDYRWYRDPSYDAAGTGILGRYKDHNNPQGNSPIATGNSQFSPAVTLYPDNEDLNRDNTLNETEEYYEYEIDLKPGMDVGNSKYITDKKIVTARLADGTTSQEEWYLFRIPIKNYTGKVGQIPDFKSIRFIRMYMTGFDDSVVMRFASLDLVRNQWRTFTYELDTTGSYTQLPVNSNTTLNVLAVNVEENSSREPIPYKIPPGIERVQLLGNNGVNLLQNEQSMSLKLNNVSKKESRAVFKTLNLDLRQYGQMSMFVHCESVYGQRDLNPGDFTAVIRIGQDFLNNYYEIRIPLKATKFGETLTDNIWPAENNLDVALNELVQLKLRRNSANASISAIYREQLGTQTISVLGNPNLAEVQGFLIGVENTTNETLSTEVWVNELRLSKIDENGGWAALGRADIQLADLGTLSVSANTYTQGFGTIEQRANERARDNMVQYDVALTVDAGKLLPKNSGITIPVYASLNKTILTPEYDPYDKDVKYKYKLATAGDKKDSIKNVAIDQTTIRTINLTNVRFGQNAQKQHFWNLKNFDFTYSFTHFEQTNPLILLNSVAKHRFGLGYTYTGTAKYKEPFKKLIKSKSPWFALARDFNFNTVPSLLSFRADVNRQFGKYTPRIVNTYDSKVERVDTTYDKYFTFDRYYNLRWDLTRSLNADFSATNYARVDEPYGLLDTKAKKDTVRKNLFSGGRNTIYQQRAVLSYNAPLAKLPATDWINMRYSYTTTYNWAAASLLARNLGNVIENSQQNSLNTEFDFTKLYSKSRWLDKMTQPNDEIDNGGGSDSTINIKPREEIIKDLKGKAKRTALRKWRADKRAKRKLDRKNKTISGPNGIAKTAVGVVTMVKRASINYSANFNSRIPGYTDSTKILGQNWKSMQPGLDYVFGKQPDSAWLNDKARKGYITRDSTFNLLFAQDYEQRFSLTAQLEPFREFTIDINMDKTFTKNFTELFKDTTGAGSKFAHLSPLAGGGFSVSYISFQTLFKKYKPTEVSETFNKFQDNRITIANRLAKSNPYYTGGTTQDGFPTGYGRYAQDVLIPAFIAAYTNKDPNSVGLISQSNPNIKANPFSGIKPLPNWRVTFTGLTKIPAISNIFSNITITHAYNSTLSMNTFTSALLYQDPFRVGAPQFIDTISGNYVPFFLVPNLTIQEQFAPLIGFDFTTANQTSFRFEYKKSRQLSLSLIDYQLAEVKSTEWTFGGSLRSKNVKLPIKLPFMKQTDQGNDLNVNLDLSMRDDIQSNSRLDQANAYSTGGQKVITIQPSIDYVISNRIDLKFYFDQQRTVPYISTSAPTVNTRAGLQIRISLAPNPQPPQ